MANNVNEPPECTWDRPRGTSLSVDGYKKLSVASRDKDSGGWLKLKLARGTCRIRLVAWVFSQQSHRPRRRRPGETFSVADRGNARIKFFDSTEILFASSAATSPCLRGDCDKFCSRCHRETHPLAWRSSLALSVHYGPGPQSWLVTFYSFPRIPGRFFKLFFDGKVLGTCWADRQEPKQFHLGSGIACPSENEIGLRLLPWRVHKPSLSRSCLAGATTAG